MLAQILGVHVLSSMKLKCSRISWSLVLLHWNCHVAEIRRGDSGASPNSDSDLIFSSSLSALIVFGKLPSDFNCTFLACADSQCTCTLINKSQTTHLSCTLINESHMLSTSSTSELPIGIGTAVQRSDELILFHHKVQMMVKICSSSTLCITTPLLTQKSHRFSRYMHSHQ